MEAARRVCACWKEGGGVTYMAVLWCNGCGVGVASPVVAELLGALVQGVVTVHHRREDACRERATESGTQRERQSDAK